MSLHSPAHSSIRQLVTTCYLPHIGIYVRESRLIKIQPLYNAKANPLETDKKSKQTDCERGTQPTE